MNEIIFSGGSHYGIGALRSLQKEYERVYILDSNQQEIKKNARKSDRFIKNFDDVVCDIVFLGGHASLISEDMLLRKTFLNVHGALLPKYRGMHSNFWAIMNGETRLGITFHLVDKYMDSGDILEQYSFDYTGQSIQEVNDTIDSLVEKYTGSVVKRFCNGKITPQKQDIEKATWGCRRNLDDCLIDFTLNNTMLRRFFMALTYPYPLPMLVIRGIRYEVLEYSIKFYDYFGAVGRVLNIDREGAWIKTVEGFLVVKKIREYETEEVIDAGAVLKIGYRF